MTCHSSTITPSLHALYGALSSLSLQGDFPRFEDGDVTISLSPFPEDDLILHRDVLMAASPYLQAGLSGLFIQNKVVQDRAECEHERTMFRYELEGDVEYAANQIPMLIGKKSKTAEADRQPNQTKLCFSHLAPFSGKRWYRQRAILGYKLAFALLYGRHIDCQYTPEPITILGTIEAAEMCLFLPLIVDNLNSLIYRLGHIGNQPQCLDELKLRNHVHLWMIIACKIENEFIYEEALRLAAGTNVHAGLTTQFQERESCSRYYDSIECDEDQIQRIRKAYEQIRLLVADVDRELLGLTYPTIMMFEADKVAEAVWQRWLTTHCILDRPRCASTENHRRHYVAKNYRRLYRGTVTVDEVMKCTVDANMTLWSRGTDVVEETVQIIVSNFLIQARECVSKLFDRKVTAFDDDNCEGFTCVEFDGYDYPWGAKQRGPVYNVSPEDLGIKPALLK